MASLALAIPFVQDCDAGPVPQTEEDGDDGPPAGDQPCCQLSSAPACEAPDVVACVCERDAYCCDVEWDGACISQAVQFCDLVCGPGHG